MKPDEAEAGAERPGGSEPTAGRDAAESSGELGGRAARNAVYTVRSVAFALLAHPTVQAIRFVSKIALPSFIVPEQYGEAMLAGLIMFGAQHVAVFGLDEALVSASAVDARLYARLRRYQTSVACVVALVVIAVALVMLRFPVQENLGHLLLALAPMTLVANWATLPTALLVRERCYARVFAVDLVAITTFTIVAVLSAALGAGEWSLVLAWHANALAALAAATVFARPLLPRHTDGGEAFERARRTGARFTGAAVLGYVGERLDSASVGFGLGRAALGIYEQAQNQGQVMVNYATSLSERLLFPTLAAQHRGGGLGAAYRHALRLTILFLLPLHVVLAVLAGPLVRTIFPEAWHGAAPLLSLLALAAGARCFDVAAVTALKAAGRGQSVFGLGVARVVVLVVALALSMPLGVEAVAWAVLASRISAAVASLTVAAARLDLADASVEDDLGPVGRAFGLWVLVFAPAAWYLKEILDGASVPALALVPLFALVSWLFARAVFDRAALAREAAFARSRLDWPGSGSAD